MLWTGKTNLAELTDLVYAVAFGECSWNDFLDRFATTVPDGKAALHYHDLASKVASVPYMVGYDSGAVEQFVAHYAATNPWIPGASLVPIGQGVTGEDVFPRAEMLNTEFYNDWLRPQAGGETSIGVTVIRESARTFILSTVTPSIDVDLNRQVANLYGSLFPHLRRAAAFTRRTEALSDQRKAGQSLFDAIGVGLLYVSENRSIRSWNEAAQKMIASGTPIRITTSGRVAFECQKSTEALELLTSEQGKQVDPYIEAIKTPSGPSFRVSCVRLKSDPFTELMNGPTVAVIVEPASIDPADARNERLMQSFRLTRKEVRVASGILAGLSLKELAHADGVGYETVRSHLKSIYSKLEVNSQAALVALLMR